MKHTYKTIIVTILILTLASFAVFAEGMIENKSEEVVPFSSLDLETASYKTIMEAFETEVSSFKTQCDSLYQRMDEARAKGDVNDYFDAKDFLRTLEAPVITEEQTETLISRILNESDEEAKAEFANWLFTYSAYYRPSIKLTKDSTEDEGFAKYFSYSYNISANPGSTVTLPQLSGLYTSEGVFAGWGVTPDEVTYQAGEEIEMPYSDLVLYAVFKSGVLFSDSVTGTEVFEDGSEVSAPELTAPDESYVFEGWYNVMGEKVDGSETLELGDSAIYYAKWKSLAVDSVSTQYYKDLTVPAEKQIKLNFYVRNQGNMNAGNFTVELVPEDENALKVLTGSLSCYSLRADQTKSGSFMVIAHGNSGDTIKANLVITDADGNTWTEPVTLTIM